ncbi:MAG: hypothetical protein J5693_00080 [Bacteroidales bacterium]|nr:hypothetical protein [Bacteroidales bacterium]
MNEFLDNLGKLADGNKGLMLLLSSAVLALLCIEMCFSVLSGKLPAKHILSAAGKAFLTAVGVAAAGFLVTLIPASGVVVPILYYALLALAVAAVVIVYILGQRAQVRAATANALRKSASNTAQVRHAKGWLYAGCLVLLAGAVALLIAGGKYWLAVLPVAVVAVALLLHKLIHWRIWYAVGLLAVLLLSGLALKAYFLAPQMAALPAVAVAVAAVAMLLMSSVTLSIRRD